MTGTWTHPWEMALLDTKTLLGRPVGKFDGLIGKEFMGDEEVSFR